MSETCACHAWEQAPGWRLCALCAAGHPCAVCDEDEDEAPLWAVVASHEGHYDYVLAIGLTEADARETAEHEGAPFYAKPVAKIYDR